MEGIRGVLGQVNSLFFLLPHTGIEALVEKRAFAEDAFMNIVLYFLFSDDDCNNWIDGEAE